MLLLSQKLFQVIAMSNEDESDIKHTGDSNTKSDEQCDFDTKWMLIKSNNDIYRRFMCEFKNGRKRCMRKCIRCKTVVVLRNHGTRTMHNHVIVCEKISVVVVNYTRWNSVLDMLCRLRRLKKSLEYIDDDIKEFDWQRLNSVCDVLEPLKDCTLELQKLNAGIHF